MKKKITKKLTQEERNIQTTLDVLKDEVNGDVEAALKKTTADYSMTWVYSTRDGKLFPRSTNKKKKTLEDIYEIKNRKYDIRNICAAGNVVMFELIESYPDPDTKKVYRTPEVIVLEFKGAKIARGRHYCDPRVSYMHLSEKKAKSAYHELGKHKHIIIS